MKGEDKYASFFNSSSVAGYAVFDGHGGKGCSTACADSECGVLARLLGDVARMPSTQEIEDVFWQMDADAGPALCVPNPISTHALTAVYRLE